LIKVGKKTIVRLVKQFTGATGKRGMKIFIRTLLTVIAFIALGGCLGMPESVSPVDNFNVERYLGKWYEIARLDHSFERGLEKITADYSRREDGSIAVLNRGYSPKEGEWREAKGKARFVGEEDTGYLKVSFFGPFYGSYVIFELEKENYSYSFVTGPDLSYLWLLSRTPSPPEEVVDRFINKSKALGFDVNNLIFVNHDNDS
jgi:apolipoprotein D and lipocalin family protein